MTVRMTVPMTVPMTVRMTPTIVSQRVLHARHSTTTHVEGHAIAQRQRSLTLQLYNP